MDSRRFDTLTRTIATTADRRLLLRGLLGGVVGWAASPADGPAATSGCNRKAYKRCTAPVVKKLVNAAMRCDPKCKKPKSSACRTCLKPAVDAAAPKVRACAAAACRRGSGGDAGTTAARAAQMGQAGTPPLHGQACNFAGLSKCQRRGLRDFVISALGELGQCQQGEGRACAVAVTTEVVKYQVAYGDCSEDMGCTNDPLAECVENPGPSGGNGVCCRRHQDGSILPCNGGCCVQGQECCNGECVAVGTCCDPTKGEFHCIDRCCTTATERCCGGRCCPKEKAKCVDGKCIPCPLGSVGCGNKCCDADEMCVRGTCKDNPCFPGKTPCGTGCCKKGYSCVTVGRLKYCQKDCTAGQKRCGDSCVPNHYLCCEGKNGFEPLNPLTDRPRYCCEDGTGSICLLGDVCCIGSRGQHFCCEVACNGDFCGG